ncbi:MAG: iron chelate uptake ABC transporter family permease subunit [Acidimicrobiia bacterium]|nr:iron chelate uptake ABC transporter family permease subunit [Acidimicrobiia bacterium]
MSELWTDYTLRNVAMGSALLGVVSGVLGCFATLRRQSLLGDALSHAALPGICVAYLVTGSRAPLVLLLGAAVASWLAATVLLRVVKETPLGEDTGLGIVLSVFFGVGVVLLTIIGRSGDAGQAGLDRYLFGQAATLVTEDVATMAGLGAVAIALVALLYKELKLTTFDPAFAESIGFGTTRLGLLFTTLLVLAIAIGLQTVGVVLMAAMLIGPAVAARQWTDDLARMLVIAAAVGATSGVVGARISISQERLPTGPVVILVLMTLLVLSLLFAPARGAAWQAWRRRRQERAWAR